jgi:hypothetical protein
MSVLKTVKDYLPLLALLNSKRVKSSVKKTLLDCPKIQDILCLCSLNILKGRLPLTVSQKRALKKYKKILLTISKKNCSRKQKQKHLAKNQTGGFLGAVLGPVLATLGGPIVKAISSLFTGN